MFSCLLLINDREASASSAALRLAFLIDSIGSTLDVVLVLINIIFFLVTQPYITVGRFISRKRKVVLNVAQTEWSTLRKESTDVLIAYLLV